MSRQEREKAEWKLRSDQAMDELFPFLYSDAALAKRLYQRLVDEPLQQRRQFIADEIARLKLVGAP